MRPSFVVIVSALGAGCQSTETCNPPPTPVGVTVGAPEGVVASIVGEGACTGTPRCVPHGFDEPFVAGCERYQLRAQDVGRCSVVVKLTNGTEQRFETNIVAEEFCDSRTLVAESRAATTFEVHAPDSGTVDDAAGD